MKRIKASLNPQQWPRQEVKTIECRKRDLVVRIADWSRNREEPAFDVEVYIGGVYDWNESKTFGFHHQGGNKKAAKQMAVEFAAKQIAKLL